MSEADDAFRHIRRLIGIRDFDHTPTVDRVIREELELNSIAGGQVSIRRIRHKLQLPDDDRWR